MRDDRAGVTYHNTGKMMSGARGLDRVRARKPRGDVGRRKTVAGRRGIDDRPCHGLGLDPMRNPFDAQDARGFGKLQHDLVAGNARQQAIMAFAGIERQQILGRGQHDIGNCKGFR